MNLRQLLKKKLLVNNKQMEYKIDDVSSSYMRENVSEGNKIQVEVDEEKDCAASFEEYKLFRDEYIDDHFHDGLFDKKKMEIYRIQFMKQTYDQMQKGELVDAEAKISIVDTHFYGLQYTYQVILGPFKFNILMANCQRHHNNYHSYKAIEEDKTKQYSTFTETKFRDYEYATKRMYLGKNGSGWDWASDNEEIKQQIRKGIKQYCFYKLFSFLGIGPRILYHKYDLVLFKDCIEFKMELCSPFNPKFADIQQCQNDLSAKLLLMHSFNIVHGCIKPEHILYSKKRKQFLFCDLKGAEMVELNLVEVSKYWSEDHNLQNGKLGYRNQYISDLSALKETVFSMHAEYVRYIEEAEISKSQDKSKSIFLERKESKEETNYQKEEREEQGQIQNMSESAKKQEQDKKLIVVEDRVNEKVNMYVFYLVHQLSRRKERETKKIVQIARKYLYMVDFIEGSQNLNTIVWYGLWDMVPYSNSQPQKIKMKVIQWKNCSLHYGSQSQQAMECLERVKQSVSRYTSKIPNHQNNFKFQIQVACLIKAVQMHLDGLVHYLNFLIRSKRTNVRQVDKEEDLFIATHYIHLVHYLNERPHKKKMLGKLVYKYFWGQPADHVYDQIQVRDHCYSLLENVSEQFVIFYLEKIQYKLKLSIEFTQSDLEEIISLITAALEIMKKDAMNAEKYEVHLFCYQIIKFKRRQQFKKEQFSELKQQYKSLVLDFIDKKLQKEGITFEQTYYFANIKIEIIDMDSPFEQVQKQCLKLEERYQSLSSAEQKQYLKKKVSIISFTGWFYYNNQLYDRAERYFIRNLQLIELGEIKDRNFIVKTKIWLLEMLSLIKQKEKKIEEVIASSQKLIEYLNIEYMKSNRSKKLFNRIMNTKAILLSALLENGLGNQYRQKSKDIVEGMVLSLKQFYEYQKYSKSTFCPVSIFDSKNQKFKQEDINFINQTIVNFLRNKKELINIFHFQYANANYELAKYYAKQQARYNFGMKYLWRYLLTRLTRCFANHFSETDLQIATIYAQCLMRCQSNRIAVRFLNHFLKVLPSQLNQDIRVKLFQMMHKAMLAIANSKEPLYNELTKNKCKKIRQRNFQGVVDKLSKNQKEKNLYEKEIKKLFFIDLRRRKQSDEFDFENCFF